MGWLSMAAAVNRIPAVSAESSFKRSLIEFKKVLMSPGHEDCKDYMYLDSTGNVTVGVGNMLPTAAAAKALPFLKRATDKSATDAEKEVEWKKIKDMPKGNFTARYYLKHTTLMLSAASIQELLDKRIDEFLSQLRQNLPQFDTYPPRAQFALLDMAFNLGTSRLVTGFPTLIKAVKDQNWTKAASECKRRDISDGRNRETEELFLTAVM